MISVKTKNKKPLAIYKCEKCGAKVGVLYWNREEQKWLCKECQFRKEKKSK